MTIAEQTFMVSQTQANCHHRRVHFVTVKAIFVVCLVLEEMYYFVKSKQPSCLMQSKHVVTQQMLEADAGKTAASYDNDIKSEPRCSRMCPTPVGGAVGCSSICWKVLVRN